MLSSRQCPLTVYQAKEHCEGLSTDCQSTEPSVGRNDDQVLVKIMWNETLPIVSTNTPDVLSTHDPK